MNRLRQGNYFKKSILADIKQRADKRLIQDLKLVRKALLETGLETRHAHALIGRAIFIRYLEDREILTSTYFESVAAKNSEWQKKLSKEFSRPVFSSTTRERWFYRVLQNKTFTYALFEQLALDFNGDMFPRYPEEENAVKQSHLDLLSMFLLGDTNLNQPMMFLWAYDFQIIPIDLISSIYEEFYHTNNDDDQGTHYTPSVLVEYVLQEVLNSKSLTQDPRILDPTCGSGIFLVEAFRRIVRYQVQRLGRQLTTNELRNILKAQIAGIEINTEAVHVAAFSLYLALLHYQHPPDIRQNSRLPNLIFRQDQATNEDSFGILFNNNTFDLTETEFNQLTTRLESQPRFKGRANLEKFVETSKLLPVTAHSFDIVIGNPPWGSSRSISEKIQNGWCDAFEWPNGDKEPSQAFIARAISLLKPDGICGFLVSTGIFFKNQRKSEEFRRKWLKQVTLESVVNFAHVRRVFFSANAPFAFVHFTFRRLPRGHRVRYWSAKKTATVNQLQTVILSLPDLKQVEQIDLRRYPLLWKIYWWGNHRDAGLINRLMLEKTLGDLAEREGLSMGRGFGNDFPTGAHREAALLKKFSYLPYRDLKRYNSISKDSLVEVPNLVDRHGNFDLYSGWRILIKRGITEADSHGQIEARLEHVDYSFQDSILGVNVDSIEDWKRKILTGILWSSLARYFYFMTSSMWGLWHHKIHLHELKSLPVRFPQENHLKEQLVQIVDTLREKGRNDTVLFEQSPTDSNIIALEKQLDMLIFDLFNLSASERELIQDMCNVGLEFFYQHISSQAILPIEMYSQKIQGTVLNLPITSESEQALDSYLRTFLQIWNRELEPTGEFSWQVIRPDNVPMITVIFRTQDKGQPLVNNGYDDLSDWSEVLKRCSEVLHQPISHRIYIDGMVRIVTDTEIYIIKRDERRLWTRSMAREDAEATRLQAMNLEQSEAA